jgi:hypothetical protein
VNRGFQKSRRKSLEKSSNILPGEQRETERYARIARSLLEGDEAIFSVAAAS